MITNWVPQSALRTWRNRFIAMTNIGDIVVCSGEIVEKFEKNGEKFKLFYGMSSQHAMEKHYGKMEKYRSSEGRRIEVPYKGPLDT